MKRPAASVGGLGKSTWLTARAAEVSRVPDRDPPFPVEPDGGGAGMDTKLGVDVVEVPHGPGRDAEALSDLGIRPPLGDEIQDLPLALWAGVEHSSSNKRSSTSSTTSDRSSASMRSGSPVAVRRRSRSHDASESGSRFLRAEVAVEQLARGGAGECDAVVHFEKDDGCLGRLVQRERLAEVPSSLTGAEKLHEVRIRGVEDSTVARAEIASDTVEAEFPCPPWRPDAEPKLKQSVSPSGSNTRSYVGVR